ncbi:MAG: FHA domain-containing protein [Alphaproteobacteria bacterium]|nr:FHA domain-containing protein [Alphaproteobacteria bacterium]
MGVEIAALLGFFGVTGFFAAVGAVLAGWMAWRICEKAGFPGWMGLGATLLILTGVGAIIPFVLLWVFAYMRWPRDDEFAAGHAGAGGWSPAGPPAAPVSARGLPPVAGPGGALPPPPRSLSAPAARFRLVSDRMSIDVPTMDGAYLVTAAPATTAQELSIADPSIGTPHARLMVAGARLGLEDLGSAGGSFVDGARLLPEHGPRDISTAQTLRLGALEFRLERS